MIYPLLWFVVVTVSIVFALPKILDAFLYYFDKRSTQWMQEVEMMNRKNEIIREQIKLQEIQRQRRQSK